MSAAMGFGDDFVADDIEHRTGGKGQTPRQQRLRQCDDARPSRPPIGSTIPVRVAIPQARSFGYPSPRSETATASPSGAFCKPMPIASGRPPCIPPDPNPTPTARPSGKLWIVIAMMKSQTRRKDAASGPSRPVLKCSCGNLSFIRATAPMPRRIAMQTMAAGAAPLSNGAQPRPAQG